MWVNRRNMLTKTTYIQYLSVKNKTCTYYGQTLLSRWEWILLIQFLCKRNKLSFLKTKLIPRGLARNWRTYQHHVMHSNLICFGRNLTRALLVFLYDIDKITRKDILLGDNEQHLADSNDDLNQSFWSTGKGVPTETSALGSRHWPPFLILNGFNRPYIFGYKVLWN